MARSTRFQNKAQVMGINDFAQYFCTEIYTATLAINTDTTLTVPGLGGMGNAAEPSKNKFVAVIKVTPNASVWVALGATAAVPAGASFAASTSELVPASGVLGKIVSAGDVIHVLSPAANVSVSISFYTSIV